MKKIYKFLVFLQVFLGISLYGVSQTTLVTWTFPNNPDNATADVGIAANLSKTIGAYKNGTLDANTVFGATGVTTRAANNAAIWDYSDGADYWQIDVVTTGYTDILLSYSLYSTANKSPEDFKTQYNIGTGWVNLETAFELVKDEWFVRTDIALPAVCNNQSNVSIRWITTTDQGVGGTQDGSAANKIDNIVVKGTLAPPMSFVSCTSTQNNTTNVFQNSTNNEVIGVQIVTTGASSPLTASSFTFTTSGTTNVADITNAKLWTTGTSSTFATTTQLGSTVLAPSGTFTINSGTNLPYTLASGTNYFWLTYDVPATATKNNYIDATCTSLNVTSDRTPSTQNPVGSRQIKGLDGTFESGASFPDNGMIVVNGSQTNKWYVGTPGAKNGTKGAYISDDGGITNSYDIGTSSVSHFYFDYTFPAGETNITLDFDWKCNGESSTYDYDNLKVFLVPTTVTPVAGTAVSSTYIIGDSWYSLQTTWQHKQISIDAANAGTTKRIVFQWKNDGSLGTDPPAAVDNIAVTHSAPSACSAPTCPATGLNLTSVSDVRIDGTFTAAVCPTSGYLVIRSTSPTLVAGDLPVNVTTYAVGNAIGDGTVVSVGTNTSFSATGLTKNTRYYFWVFNYNNTSCTGGPTYNTTSPANSDAYTRPLPPNPFTSAVVSSSQINVTYTAIDAMNVVIVWNTTGTFTSPADGSSPPPVGDAFAGGTVLSYGTSSPVNHTGLNSGTTYYYRAFSYNTTSKLYSTYANTNSTTLCGVATLPYAQNFDAVSTPSLPNCWAIEDNSAVNDDWMSSTTYPRSTPNCMYISWDGTAALNDWAFSPGFALTKDITYELTFYYRANSTLSEKLEVKWGTAQTSASMYATALFQNTNVTNTTYQLVTVTVTPTSTGTYYFGWHAYSAANKYGIHVDDINIRSLETCSGTPATAVISSNITTFCGTGSVTLTATSYDQTVGITYQWQSSPSVTNWTNISGATSSSYSGTITDDTKFRLVTYCSNGGANSISNEVIINNTSEEITGTTTTFSGVCSTVANLSATATGSSTIHWWNTETGGTLLQTGGTYNPTVTQTTTFYVSTGSGGTNGNVGKATSDLSDGYYGSTETGLVFNALATMDLISVKVYVQTAGSTVSIVLKNSTGTTLQTASFTNCPAGFQTLTLNFTGIAVGTGYKLVSNNSTALRRDFSGNSFPYTLPGVCSITDGTLSDTYYFFYDWVVSTGCESARTPVTVNVTSGISAPVCSSTPLPANLATGIDPSTTLSWAASSSSCQQATSYKLYFGTDNPPTNMINGLNMGNVLTYDQGTLTAPTTYYWKVVPLNTAGSATGCDVWSFTTQYTYCSSSADYDTYSLDISKVELGTINNSSAVESLTGSQGIATGTAGKYSNWKSSAVPVTTLAQGGTYPISITTDGEQYSHKVTVYIDYNRDGDLTDAGESINVFAYASPSLPNTSSVNIVVPEDATTGQTLMRVVCSSSSTAGACGTYSYGETEDYTIQIGVPGTNTIDVAAGVEPLTTNSSINAQGLAVLNFDFTVKDDGLTDATDILPTLIDKITFKQGTGNEITDWSKIIAGALLTDDEVVPNTQTVDVTINATSIVFSNIPNDNNQIGKINDNGDKVYTLKIWLKCPPTGTIITEGDNFVFEVNNTTILVEANGSSGFASGENENSGITNNAISSTATKLVFIQDAVDVEANMIMFPYIKVAAVDACGIIDIDFVSSITLTAYNNAPALINTFPAETAKNGIATFKIIFTPAQVGVDNYLKANSGVYNETSSLFDIFPAKVCQITTVPNHNNGELLSCLGDRIDFSGSLTSGTPVSWSWNMGDGTDIQAQSINDYEFTDASGYFVELTVVYNTNQTCVNSVRVMVSGGATINNISEGMESCDGFTYTLLADGSAGSAMSVTSFEGTGAVGLSLADQTYLPDIETDHESYYSTLEFTQFDAGDVLTSGDLVTVYANLEHSYWGDLEIWIDCPNHQTAHLTDGYHDAGAANVFLGEAVDEDALGTAGNGMEYRWTMVSPSMGASMDDIADISPFPYDESYTDNAGTEVTAHDYFPSGSYYPLDAFTDLVGCPLNGVWTIWVTDYLGVDDGYIFEWGLELDRSLMPKQWEYETEIGKYQWSGETLFDTGGGAYVTGATAVASPANYGDNIYTLTITDNIGCSASQEVTLTMLECDGQWTGKNSTDWNEAGNWAKGFVPDGTCAGGFGRDVTIPNVSVANGGSGNFPVISTTAFCENLTINSGANLQIAAGGKLTVCGDVVNQAGNSGLVIKSSATGDGSLIHNTADVPATIERYIEGLQFHYLSSPIESATDAGIGIAGGTSGIQFYQWDASVNWLGMTGYLGGIDYAPWTVASGALEVGKGYAYYYETQMLNYVGEINVGDYNKTCGYNSSGVALNQGWNFFGNPYTASLDWDVIAANMNSTNIEKTLYMFNDNGSALQSRYVYYLPSGGTTPSISISATGKFVPHGQGFFVKAKNSSATLPLLNEARTHGTQAFFKEEVASINVLRLLLNNSATYDELAVRLIADGTINFDGDYDARKLRPSNTDIPIFYTITADEQISAINSLPSLNAPEITVPIGIVANAGNYYFSITEQTLEYGKQVYLIDNVLSIETKLDLNTTYEFTYAGGIDESRFELKFTSNQTPIVTNSLIDISINEDLILNYLIPENTFVDLENDVLTYEVTVLQNELSTGWLNVDSDNMIISGIPDNSNVGTYEVEITASDIWGSSTDEYFNITVNNVNDFPIVNILLNDYYLFVGEELSIDMDDHAFVDIDANDELIITSVYPSWITFDNLNLTYTGIAENVGTEEIQLTAQDLAGASTSVTFNVIVSPSTSIIESVNFKLAIYPNPSNDIFIIEKIIGTETYDVLISDLTGKIIYQLNNNKSDKLNIDLSSYANGLYYIEITTDEQVFREKLIKR